MHRPALVSCALALCAHTATHAESNITVYGIADTGVERLTNVNAQGASKWRMPNLTGLVPSRLGFRGTEDLGGGLSAFFNLEMGLALDGGTLNNGGRSFGRAANVGLAGSFGRITLGRQINMTILAVSSHVMGPALYSFASHDSYIPNAINDNAIGYLGTFKRGDDGRNLQPGPRRGEFGRTRRHQLCRRKPRRRLPSVDGPSEIRQRQLRCGTEP